MLPIQYAVQNKNALDLDGVKDQRLVPKVKRVTERDSMSRRGAASPENVNFTSGRERLGMRRRVVRNGRRTAAIRRRRRRWLTSLDRRPEVRGVPWPSAVAAGLRGRGGGSRK